MAALNDLLLALGGNYEEDLTINEFNQFNTELQRIGYINAFIQQFSPADAEADGLDPLLEEMGWDDSKDHIRGYGGEVYRHYNGETLLGTYGCPEDPEPCEELTSPTDTFYIYLVGDAPVPV